MDNLINDQQPVISSPAHASNEVLDVTAHIPSLVRQAKHQGFLTHEDIERLVPACADDPEMAGQILDLLGQSGVSVNPTYDEPDVAEGGEADDESLGREDNDLLATYLKKVRRTQILTREEEFALFARIDAAIAGGQESEALRLRNEVVQRNLRLVFSLARRYLNRGLPLGDLIQEGNIGLLKAVDKFDLRRGYKLSTYAFYWIRQSIVRALCKHGRTISIPSHLFEKLNRIAAAQDALTEELGRAPMVSELAERIGLPPEELYSITKGAYRQSSLQSVLGKDADETDPESVQGLMMGGAYENPSLSSSLSDIPQVMDSLSTRERDILYSRFGLNDRVEMTLEEIAARYGVTRERIRQIQDKALRKLRHPARLRVLQEMSEGSLMQTGNGFSDLSKAS